MIAISSLDSLPTEIGPTVVTIGKFDGIHLGHQKLIAEAIALAEEHMLVPTLITFDKHPGSVLNPDNQPVALIGPNQKLDLLNEAGIELVVTLAFDEALANLSAREFAADVLISGLAAKAVVVGDDFKFGNGQEGNVETLRELGKELGFAVSVIAGVELDGQRVSTTFIRGLLNQGKVTEAARFLGRNHVTRGEVEHGLKIGRELGFPTANISRLAEGMLPLDGVYAGWLHAAGEKYPAALSIGINETITAVPRLLEVHVLDRRDLDLYDLIVDVEYIEFIRPSLKFSGVEELIASINADLEKIRVILG